MSTTLSAVNSMCTIQITRVQNLQKCDWSRILGGFLMFNKLLKEIAHICIMDIPGYMVRRRGKTLYVQNGRKVKCQRRYVTQLVDKLGTRSIRTVILSCRELPVSLSLMQVRERAHTSLSHSIQLLIYTCRARISVIFYMCHWHRQIFPKTSDGRAHRPISAVVFSWCTSLKCHGTREVS